MLEKIRGLKLKAVFWGVLTDTIGTLSVATILVFAMAASGLPGDEITARMHGFSGIILMLIIGLGFTLVGGYVAGRTAGQSEILHGAIVAGIGLILSFFFRETGLPLWYELVSFAAMVPVGMAGGYIAREGKATRGLP
jgi:putative membrane protein (TIGR04086 family)